MIRNENSNNSRANTTAASKVIQFYNGKNLFITGASGFLGKVLLWKLLMTCPDLGKVYVLIRSKENVSAEKRLAQIFQTKPFDNEITNNSRKLAFEKVVAIEGDVCQVGLGLSDLNRQLLKDQVNIVIHSAASVRFDAPLKDNLRDNFYGTRNIVDFCNGIKNLDAFVHVSTAFSNCHQRDIGEIILPLSRGVDEIVKTIEDLPNDVSELLTDKLLEGRPNTYTFTKAMAEQYVAKQEGKYPISIVRPSIVINSKKEPSPGWVDNVNGISGLGCLAAIGVLRTIDWNYYGTSDMVPVDFVANCIICAAYQSKVHTPNKMTIYNMTSGNMKPISWGVFFDMLRATAVKTPPNKIIRPMIHSPRYKRANPINFFLVRYFSELLFAYLVDIILRLIGYKPVLVKITKKMHHGYKILLPFTAKEFNFISNNVTNLSDSLQPVDRDLFKFDMRDFSWLEQADAVWTGGRHYILKEEPSEESFRGGRIKMAIATVIHYCFIMLMVAAVTYIIYSTTTLLKAS